MKILHSIIIEHDPVIEENEGRDPKEVLSTLNTLIDSIFQNPEILRRIPKVLHPVVKKAISLMDFSKVKKAKNIKEVGKELIFGMIPKQFHPVIRAALQGKKEELKKAIIECGKNLVPEELKKLVECAGNRDFNGAIDAVVEAGGKIVPEEYRSGFELLADTVQGKEKIGTDGFNKRAWKVAFKTAAEKAPEIYLDVSEFARSLM